MSDDHGAVASPATGPAQARALRRASLDIDDEGAPGTEELVEPSRAPTSSADRAGPNDSARDTATAADQAARMSALNARSDDLLERLRGNGAEIGAEPDDREPPAAEAPTRRRWRRS